MLLSEFQFPWLESTALNVACTGLQRLNSIYKTEHDLEILQYIIFPFLCNIQCGFFFIPSEYPPV